MLAKTGERFSQDWDKHLPYVLYAYRSTAPRSHLCTVGTLHCEALSCECSPYMIDLNDYKTDLMTGLTIVWKFAQENIKLAQQRDKSAMETVGQHGA